MDSTSTFYAQEAEDLNVFRDAFAPPSTTTRAKLWDRAPVSAHAPRLQGHKIWKRTGLRSASGNHNKENDAAQVELASEGAGARKKARVQGLKENILDATWKDEVAQKDLLNAIASPEKRDMSPVKNGLLGIEDALVVPRKRTNANHLITPRRRSKRVPLGDVNVGNSLSPVKMVRTPKRDVVAAIGDMVPLNDVVKSAAMTAEKPTRRRKSMRKSLRRLSTDESFAITFTGNSLAENIPRTIARIVANPLEDTPQETVPPSSSGATGNVLLESLDGIIELPQEDPFILDLDNQAEQRSCPIISPLCSAKTEEQNTSESRSHSIDPSCAKGLEDAISPIIPTNTPSVIDSCAVKSVGILEKQVQATGTQNDSTKQVVLAPEAPAIQRQSPMKSMNTPRRSTVFGTPLRGSTRKTRSCRKVEMQNEQVDAAARQPSLSTDTISASPSKHVEPQFASMVLVGTTENVASNPQTTLEESRLEPNGSSAAINMKSINDELENSATCDEMLKTTTKASDPLPRLPDVEEESTAEVAVSDPDASHHSALFVNGVMSDVPEAVLEERFVEADIVSTEADAASESRTPILSGEALSKDSTFESELNESTTDDDDIGAEEFEIIAPSTVLGDNKDYDMPLENEGNLSTETYDEANAEDFDIIAPTTSTAGSIARDTTPESEELAESSTPDPSTTKLVEVISENATVTSFAEDDTDLLRNFLTRVKANKEAKANAATITTKRKRSFPHSPMKLPLESSEAELALSPNQSKDESEIPGPASSPTKRRRRNEASESSEATSDTQSIRRSGRTRLPVKASAIPAPNFIPVRRLGQENDGTVTLRRNEEKDLATLTRVNTRKNKGSASSAPEMLVILAQEKENPALRHQALKQKFEAKTKSSTTTKKKKNVVWAEEIAQYSDGKKPDVVVEAVETEKEVTMEEKKSSLPVKANNAGGGAEEKKSKPVKVGVRSSRIAMGMATTGTPAPKRRVKSARS